MRLLHFGILDKYPYSGSRSIFLVSSQQEVVQASPPGGGEFPESHLERPRSESSGMGPDFVKRGILTLCATVSSAEYSLATRTAVFDRHSGSTVME
jgi:hypothetical protein